MPLQPSWPDILLRLALTMIASGLLGLDRGSRGHAAGLRTTVLVGLAAALSTIQVNLLLPMEGKSPGSFAMLDLMRLPLGILTGVGFIGGGAILKLGTSVRGVTTAATLWVATVLGLCYGGGQIALGLAGTIVAVATLFGLRWIDARIPRIREGDLVIAVVTGSPEPDVEALLRPLGCVVRYVGQDISPTEPERTKIRYRLHWSQSSEESRGRTLLRALEGLDVACFEVRAESHL